jgi:hypothetical protein
MSYSHFYHYISHIELYFPLNILHVYHHSTQTTVISYILELIYEFLTLFVPIIFIFLYSYYLPKDNPINKILSIFNVWGMMLYLLFYLTMHNINYSLLHVNDIHKIHHEKLIKNMSPDICDIVFFTKDDITKLENTDNMIPNILLPAILLYFVKKGFERYPNTAKNSTIYVIYTMIWVAMISSFIIYIDYIDYYYKEEIIYFKKMKREEMTVLQWNKFPFCCIQKIRTMIKPYLLYESKDSPFFRKEM